MRVGIVDVETTGFLKDGGKIVEIGIVELDTTSKTKKVLFDKVINPNLKEEILFDSWICQNGYMTPKEILNGVQFESIKEELQNIISGFSDGITAFNRDFDVDHLEVEGIKFNKLLGCPMKISTNICKIPSPWGYKWPKAQEAYDFFYPNSDYTEIHRGADDAWHEADIVYELFKLGHY